MPLPLQTLRKHTWTHRDKHEHTLPVKIHISQNLQTKKISRQAKRRTLKPLAGTRQHRSLFHTLIAGHAKVLAVERMVKAQAKCTDMLASPFDGCCRHGSTHQSNRCSCTLHVRVSCMAALWLLRLRGDGLVAGLHPFWRQLAQDVQHAGRGQHFH